MSRQAFSSQIQYSAKIAANTETAMLSKHERWHENLQGGET